MTHNKSARAEGRRKVTLGPTHSSKWRCSSGDHPFISARSPEGSGDPLELHTVITCAVFERLHLWLMKAQ